MTILNVVLINVFSGLQNGFYYSDKDWKLPTIILLFMQALFCYYSVETFLTLGLMTVSVVYSLLMISRVLESKEPNAVRNKRLHFYEHMIKDPIYLIMLIEGMSIGSILTTIFIGNFLFNIPIQVSYGRPAISWDQGKGEEDIWIFGKKIIDLPRFNSGWVQLIIALFTAGLYAVSIIYNFDYNIYDIWQHIVQKYF